MLDFGATYKLPSSLICRRLICSVLSMCVNIQMRMQNFRTALLCFFQRLDFWNLDVKNSGNCAFYDRESSRFQMTNCKKKSQYICRVQTFYTHKIFLINALSNIGVSTVQIEISFPDSCFHPYHGFLQIPFYWDPWSGAASDRNVPIATAAKETNRDPGRRYYFKCDAKIYMGIMRGV